MDTQHQQLFKFFIFVDAGGLGSLESKVNPKGLYTGPYFSPAILSNYTVMAGDTVHLPCQVGGLRSLESKMNPKGLYSTPDPTSPSPSSPITPSWWGTLSTFPIR
jgi:hypothetical protein